MKRFIVRKSHSAELLIEEISLFRCWINSYFGGLQHVTVFCYDVSILSMQKDNVK